MSHPRHTRCHFISKYFPLILLIPFLLSSCAGLTRIEQPKTEEAVGLAEGQTVGQTFVATYDGLSGVYFHLSLQEPGDGILRLHLRADPQATDDLAVSNNSLSIEKIGSPDFYGFMFPSQPESNKKYYYAYLELTGSGSVQVGTSGGDTYLSGALQQDGAPLNAQSAFRLAYSRRMAAGGLALEVLAWAGILLAGGFLFLLPGWGLFSLFWRGWEELTWPEKLGLSAGLSLAVYPLLFLWTSLMGLHLGAVYAWLPPLAGLLMILWQNGRKYLSRSRPRPPAQPRRRVDPLSIWTSLVFLVIAAFLVFTRFWAVRSLDYPMGLDSYHHTLIAQLLVDHGGLFTSWAPYAELTTFTYHFGFHTAVAVFHWVTRMDMPRAVLYVGQVLNLLSLMALYPLTYKITRNRWAGLVTLLVAGLVSPMPMYYPNWGRYTQLAGQVILPAVAWVLWSLLSAGPEGRKGTTAGRIAMASLAMGGLALTHYRILILAVLLLIPLWILYARRDTLRQIFARTFWVGLCSGLLFLPWFIHVFGGRIMRIFAHQMATSAAKALEADPAHSGGVTIAFFMPYFLWLASAVIIGIGAWRRDKGVAFIGLWWFINFLAANPSWLMLPGSGAISKDAINMAAYIPAGILLGAAAGWLEEVKPVRPRLQAALQTALYGLGTVLVLGIGVWGVGQRLRDLVPSTFALITRPDFPAMEWVQENTPPDSRFVVNSFGIFGNTTIVGADGGLWLPYLTQRKSTLPPLSYGFEKDPWPGYLLNIRDLTLAMQSKSIQDPGVFATLRDQGVSYVYIGQMEGEVNSPGPLFTASELLADDRFEPVYHQDRVWIFRIR